MKISYDDLLDFEKIENAYYIIKCNTKHKEKILKYEIFYASNTLNILNILQTRNFSHGRYNVFLITYPKCRIIMSENMNDKIINHLVSKYVLFPIIEPRLIPTNVATRKDKGTKTALEYLKKYINKLKLNYDKIYVLKCDVHKYFYSIDHEVLLNKLDKIITDKEIFNLVKSIVTSTNYDYVNEEINNKINSQKEHISKLKISNKEKKLKYEELDRLPRYFKGKGLPIGNMTSQIMAIFYLNDLDHFIKEKLHIKYYIRYMDDLVLLHHDKEYLKICLRQIEEKMNELKLHLNNKTQIYELHKGFPFLGYKFLLKGKKLYILLNPNTKKRIMKRLKKCKNNSEKRCQILKDYNGYLSPAISGGFIRKELKKIEEINKNEVSS